MKLASFYLSAYFGLILSEVAAQQQQKRTGLRARVRSTLSREKACTKELHECRDGTLVGRDGSNNCEFQPCPSGAETQQEEDSEGVMCAADARECPDGSFVGRDSENNCEFRKCKTPNRPTLGMFANFGGNGGNPSSRPSFGGGSGPSDNHSPPNFSNFGGSFGGGNNNGGRFPNFGGFNRFGGN